MDIILPIIGAAMTAAAAFAGYRAGKSRKPVNHARELQKIGELLGVPRLRRETNDDYAARLLEHMSEMR